MEVFGKTVTGPLPQDVAFVFQENALFPWNTVRENVDLGMRFQGVAKAEREERAQGSLEAVGLTAGWRCWEVGAGGPGIPSWLVRRVGPDGEVLATDIDVSSRRW